MNLFSKKKKGFTIVELVIVVAVIAVLSAILIPTFVGLVNKAHIAADDSLVRDLNNALAIDREVNGEHKTMSDALKVTDEYGFNVQRINAKANKSEILWDSENDVFCYFDGQTETIKYIPETKLQTPANQVKGYQYFVIKKGVASSSDLSDKYSTYLYQSTATSLTTTKGLDVGDETRVSSIKYSNNGTAQDVVIRTNSASTTLTIDDASTGTINHYGSAGELNIIQCHTGSYHENGKVAYAEIAKGRIVLEKGADVEEIHINKKTDSSFDTVIIANNGGTEELPERITRDAVEVSSQTLVVKVESNGSSENVYVYANGTTGTTEKVTEGENKQNEAVNSALGQLVLDNGFAGEKAQTISEKETAKTEAVNKAVYQEKIDTVSTKWTGETVELVTVTRNWMRKPENSNYYYYVLPYDTKYGPGFGENRPAESEDEFNTYYNNAVSFVTMVETTLSGKFYLDTNEKTIHVCGADCLQYLYLLDDYLSAKNQIACKETKYPFNVFYNAEVGWGIKVDNDIDLGGKIENDNIINNWTPVNSQLAVDFQCHKVTNLVTDRYIVENGSITNTSGASGLFGFTGGQIKNLVLENVTIFNLSASQSSYAGAIAGKISSGIFNCKVINANITSSKYVGGIAGMGFGSIENCTIENSTITGGYKLGGLIGQSATTGGGCDFENNTLKNVTIQLDRTLCPEETAYVVGKLVGYLQNNSTITDNTLTNVSIKVSSESGYVDLTDEIDIHKGSSGSNKSNDENGLVGIYDTSFTVTF